MSDIVYYRVTGGAVLDFCRSYRDGWTETERVWSDYAASKGGKGHVRLGALRFGGVIFNSYDAPEKANGWKRYQRRCRDGTPFYVPVRSGEGREAGRALQAEFDALPFGQDAVDICPVIGFPTSVETNKGTLGVVSILSPVQIAWPDMTDSFFLTLPDVNATIRRYAERDGVAYTLEWQVPEGLEVSSRKRYELAVAEAAVRKEEREAA